MVDFKVMILRLMIDDFRNMQAGGLPIRLERPNVGWTPLWSLFNGLDPCAADLDYSCGSLTPGRKSGVL